MQLTLRWSALAFLLYAAGCDGQSPESVSVLHEAAIPTCPPDAVGGEQGCEWTYSKLAAGSNHTCAVRAETGAVVCWGQSYGALDWPRDLAFSQVATSGTLSCGILRDSGSIRCWGGATPSDLPSTGSYSQVAPGDYGVCAIRSEDGGVSCWDGEACVSHADPPSGVAFSAITVGWGYACGLRRDDSRIQCWGEKVITPPEGEMCSLSTGVSPIYGLCGLRCDGEPVCFGTTLSGLAIPRSERLSEVALGPLQVCGIRAGDHSLGCWVDAQPVAAAPGVGYEKLVVGGDFSSVNASNELMYFTHACALREEDGRVVCWGDDSAGQVSGAPSFTRFTQLAMQTDIGYSHQPSVDTVCAVREADQLVQCWGGSSPLPRDQPLSVLGTVHCGIRAEDNRSTCWSNSAPEDELNEVDDNYGVSCGIREEDHNALCWPDASDPRVSETPGAVALHGITVGNRHACAIADSDHHAVCWGDDRGGPITDLPTDVAFRQLQTEKERDPIYNYIADAQTCGIREADDLVQCWGTRDALLVAARPIGPLWKLTQSGGCGLTLDAHEAVCASGLGRDKPVKPGIKLRAFETGTNTQCGIREADGLLTCWGGILWNPI